MRIKIKSEVIGRRKVSSNLPDNSQPLRAITLIEQRFGNEYRFLGARLVENGDLLLEGQDIGDTPEQFFGEREYEYQYTIEAQHVPAVLLWLIKERFTSDIDFRTWLTEHNIPNRFDTF
jgi:hypothetical protein